MIFTFSKTLAAFGLAQLMLEIILKLCYSEKNYDKLRASTMKRISTLVCVLALLTSTFSVAAAEKGNGRPVSECKVSCNNFTWRDHAVCAKPDSKDEAICPFEVAIQRGYSEQISKPKFKGIFAKSNIALNKGDYFFRAQNQLNKKPNGIKISAWIDINNDGKLEVIGRKFHPNYMSMVGTKYGNGNAAKGENLYDVIDVYANNGGNDWRRTGAINNTTCVHARRVLPGDYNNDGFIDVVFSCHGFDNKPFPGSYSVLFLNNADGTFTQKKIGVKSYSHAATSEDFNGDGFIDILFYDANKKRPILQLNQKNGTFKKSQNSYFKTGWGARPKYYELGAVDADGDGRFDLIASERGGDLLETRVYLNNGENKFDRKNSVIIPQVKTHPDVVDVFAHNGVTYILRSAGGSYWNNSTEYGEIIQRHNITTKENTIIYENKCSKSTNNCGAVFGKLHLLTDRSGKKFLVGENTSYTKFGERVRIK